MGSSSASINFQEVLGQITPSFSSFFNGYGGEIVLGIVIFLLVLAICILPYILCPLMADKKGRSAVAWFFVAFFAGWIGVIIIACLSEE